MKRKIHSVFAVALLSSCFIFPACSDSESNSPNEPAGIDSSTSAESPDSQASGEPAYNIPLDTSGFADIQAVYQSIQPNEKALFIVRHGDREPSVKKESALTDRGVEQALSVGQKLTGDEEFNYLSTDFVRTKETCHNIAIGRGQTTFPYDTNNTFTSSAWILDKDKVTEYNSLDGNNSNIVISQWAYTGEYADAFNNLKETSESIISNTFQATQGRITVICSHDEFIVPLVAYLTDGKADVKAYETRKWLYYLAGVAIIIDENGSRRAYSIRGLDKGTT